MGKRGGLAALARKGTPDRGLFKDSLARKDTSAEDGHVLPAASLNLTTVINFQPVGGSRAAINGDFILIVELHNHVLTGVEVSVVRRIQLVSTREAVQPRVHSSVGRFIR